MMLPFLLVLKYGSNGRRNAIMSIHFGQVVPALLPRIVQCLAPCSRAVLKFSNAKAPAPTTMTFLFQNFRPMTSLAYPYTSFPRYAF